MSDHVSGPKATAEPTITLELDDIQARACTPPHPGTPAP